DDAPFASGVARGDRGAVGPVPGGVAVAHAHRAAVVEGVVDVLLRVLDAVGGAAVQEVAARAALAGGGDEAGIPEAQDARLVLAGARDLEKVVPQVDPGVRDGDEAVASREAAVAEGGR